MSLSLPTLRAQRPLIILLRKVSTSVPPKVSSASAGEGVIMYSRNWSRDKKFAKFIAPPQKGDLPSTFMLRRLGHAYEVYPLIFLCSTWFALFCFATYYSFTKIEVYLDRRRECAPGWDWENIRDNYWKQSTVAFDLDGRTRKRCEIMETLQDEMLEAAKKRGTR